MNPTAPFKSLLQSFKGRQHRKYVKKCAPVVRRINELEKQFQSLSEEELKAKTHEFMDRNKKGESLEDLLPEAFAVVKNGARRLCGTTISVCDQPLDWEMVHYDVQLIGGMALHDRHIAEMATGEGKTLVSTCPPLSQCSQRQELPTGDGERLPCPQRLSLDGSLVRIFGTYGWVYSE